MTNYEYFSGANVKISFTQINKFNDNLILPKEIIECAGISYSYQNSRQPVYSYASSRFDAVLPGREIIQGTFLVNYVSPNYIIDKIKGSENNEFTSDELFTPHFDITINFGNDSSKNRVIENCFIISMGQTIQISEQVIIEEYGFIGRNIKGSI